MHSHLKRYIDFQQCLYILFLNEIIVIGKGTILEDWLYFCVDFLKRTKNLEHPTIVQGTSNLEWGEYYNCSLRFIIA